MKKNAPEPTAIVSAEVSKINAYAVLISRAVQVSKVNTYAVLYTPPVIPKGASALMVGM